MSYGNIIQKKDKDFGLAPKDFTTYQIVFEGNIILRLTDLQNDKRSLRTGLVKQTGIITSAYTCLKPKRNPAYLHYLLHSFDTQKVFYGFGGGVRQTISYADIRSMRLPVPPREEQNKIVAFLDHKIAKIDAFIKNKKRLIELLTEQKQAVINHAVTKGLNPDVEMKDSSIDWLGAVPKHWEVNKVTRLFHRIGSGTTPESGNMQYYLHGDIPWINSGDLSSKDIFIMNAKKYITQHALNKYSVLKIYPSNTIVIAMYGASIGNIAISGIDFCVNQACCSLSNMISGLDILYAYFAFTTSKISLIEKSKGGGQPNISQDIIKQLWLPVPPIDEQKKIAYYLEERLSTIDAVITKTEKEIALIQEYKTSLISAVVTGQVDVRDIKF